MELQEVEKRPAQSIQLVDDDGIEPICFDVAEELLQGGAIDVATAEAGVRVGGRDQAPSLARDVGFPTLPLVVDRGEILFRTLEPE